MLKPAFLRNVFRVGLPAFALAAITVHGQGLFRPDLVKGGERWTITFFNDASPDHDQWATQGLCFRYDGIVGTHQRYTWWSDTYPDWNGMATQEGDQIVMHGDYDRDIGHDAMQWDIVTASPKNQGAGHWWEWREDGKFGSTIGFGNTRLERVGGCRISQEEAQYLKLPLDQNGREMASPMGNLPESDPKSERK